MRIEETGRNAARAALMLPGSSEVVERVAIRAATPADRDAVERLSVLDAAHPVAGDTLVAEVDGQIRAALPLASGRVVADPFEHTAHLAGLLELRARQLERGSKPGRRFTRRVLGGALPALGRHA
jgi:hypothetical protein